MPEPTSDESTLPPDERLDRAYRRARYVVNDFSLEIDVPQPDFDAWLTRRGCSTYAILTAWNPRSTPLPAAVNAARQATLESLLRRRGLSFVPAAGTDPEGEWPAEHGVCLLDPPPDAARELGVIYEQHAIVVGDVGGSPTLLWL